MSRRWLSIQFFLNLNPKTNTYFVFALNTLTAMLLLSTYSLKKGKIVFHLEFAIIRCKNAWEDLRVVFSLMPLC